MVTTSPHLRQRGKKSAPHLTDLPFSLVLIGSP
jgi:hypothetical protein